MIQQLKIIFLIYLFVKLIVADNNQYEHECNRMCKKYSSKMCKYNFIITESHTNGGFAINGMSPGPSIEICLGDTLQIFVHNKLQSQEVSIHWNGINQKGLAHMDGVPMISQCPILPFTSFRYDIKPLENGTYFYHAHSVLQQLDGLYGSLIVRSPFEDSTLEKILIISGQSSNPLTGIFQMESLNSVALLLNGKRNEVDFNVKSGGRYRLRLINANVFQCPVIISVNKHLLTVISVGDNLVESPKLASHIILYPGERMDVELKTNEKVGKYFLTVTGLYKCKNLANQLSIIYDETKSDEMIEESNLINPIDDIEAKLKGFDCDELGENVICSLDLKSLKGDGETESLALPSETHYIPFDVNYYNDISDDMTDYSFNIYGFSYYPWYLSSKSDKLAVAQVNRMSFKYPPSPILSQPNSIPEEMLCSIEKRASYCGNNPEFCECLQILSLPANKIVELVLIDEGFGGNASQVFHIHGYKPKVIGLNNFDKATSRNEIINMDQQGFLKRNLINPPKMSTFIVPNKGYVILHFDTNNLGYWLVEVRNTEISTGLNEPSIQFLIQVGSKESLPTVPIDFPTCGNHKGPDLIFEDE